jgi:mannose-6-phosphate isomerase-like protein (cupin superfamily)
MRHIVTCLFVLCSAAQAATQSSPPLPATDVTATDILRFIGALPRDIVSDRPIRVVDVGGYKVGVYGGFRPKALPGDAILHETKTSEVYYMLDGAGTLVTGGALADPKPPTQGLAGASLRGARIDGGVSRRVVKGDLVIIPGRTAHWWSGLDSDISYLIIRPDPDGKQTLK